MQIYAVCLTGIKKLGVKLARQRTSHHHHEIVSSVALVSADDGCSLFLPFSTCSFSSIIATYGALRANRLPTTEVGFRGVKIMLADVWVHMFAELRKEQCHDVLEDYGVWCVVKNND